MKSFAVIIAEGASLPAFTEITRWFRLLGDEVDSHQTLVWHLCLSRTDKLPFVFIRRLNGYLSNLCDLFTQT